MWIPRINAKYFNPAADGVTDDRAALQAALDAAAGGDLVIPAGVYAVGAAPGKYWCLTVPAGTRVRGEDGNVMLLQLPCGPSVRLLQLDGSDVVIQDLELNGNRAAQTPDEHRAGIFCAAARCTIDRVLAHEFTGDGIYLYAGSNNVDVREVQCHDNTRNGLTLGGGQSGVRIFGSAFTRNGAQQLDSEPKGTATCNDVTIDHCLMHSEGVSGDYAMTITGSGSGSRSSDWIVRDCATDGGIQVCWADRVSISGMKVRNPTTKPCVRVYRTCTQVEVRSSYLIQEGASSAIVDVQGTAGQSPSSIHITSNTMRATAATTHGVTCELATSVSVERNTMVGAGVPAPYVSGVYARSTLPTQPMEMMDVHDNNIVNFGQYGFLANNVAGCQVKAIEISGNVFTSNASPPSMLFAYAFDAGCPDVLLARNRAVGCALLAPLKQPPGIPAKGSDEARWVVPQ